MISTVIEAVQAVSQGNNEGKAFLYENTYKKAYYVAYKYMKNEDDALDIVQDAYIKAFDRIDQLDNALKFESWLNRIVASTALDALKKKKPLLFTDISNDDEKFDVAERFEADYSEQPEVVIDKNETSRLVQEIIGELSDEQRVCVTMYYIQEMPVREISEVLDVSDNTVMSRLHYARKNIEKKVKELEKKGTKLYTLAPIPFFVFLLGKEASACEAATIAGLFSTTGAGVATGASAGTAGAATSAGAAATGMSLGAKIAIGITAAVVAIGGAVGAGVAVYNNDNSNDSETEVVAEQEQPTINSREVLSNYYDSTLVSQYGIADHEIILNYNDLGEGDFSFISYTGKPGLMGKKFVDVDGDGNEEMLVAVCECKDVVSFYEGDDGVKVKVYIYKAGSSDGQVSELTNGQIETKNMKLYDDTIQCAYRTVDGKFYVYITDVYSMTLHQGGYQYAVASVYVLNNNEVIQLVAPPPSNKNIMGSEGLDPAYNYMPSIVNAYNALSTNNSYNALFDQIYRTPSKRESTVLFSPFSKTDPEYTDVFSWDVTFKSEQGNPVSKLISDWKFFE